MPFSIKIFTKRLNSETSNPGIFNIEFPDITESEVPFSIKFFTERINSEKSNPDVFNVEFPNITESFQILAHYLLGRRYSDSFIE